MIFPGWSCGRGGRRFNWREDIPWWFVAFFALIILFLYKTK